MAGKKRIAVFCDGTWNSPDTSSEGVSCATNVVRMAEAVKRQGKDGVEQKMFYDPGVGASGGRLRRVFEGATGTGLSKNVREAYRYLSSVYELGDELYLFGFSRGAFTARSLAGLIRNSGLLCPENLDRIDMAYKLYRARGKDSHPRAREAVLFRKTYAFEDVTPVKFIGVWDTVGALGNPAWLQSPLSRRNSFHDTSLSSKIENAFQALAVDEKRRHFKNSLWVQDDPAPKGQTLEQVWFAGVHSDLGGGYPQTGLSDIPLKWMIDKAKSCGLEFSPFRPGPKPAPMAQRHESRKGFYRIVAPYHRKVMQTDNANESLHSSLEKRYREDPSYKPENLRHVLGPKP